MIVVDLGCLPWGDDRSTRPLIERFKPELYFGFDPHPETMESVQQWSLALLGGDDWATLVFSRRAAWIYDGVADFVEAGIRSGIPKEIGQTGVCVPCFDLGSFITLLPPVEIVVKMDIEGGEYPLLENLRERQLDLLISLLLVEWHTGPKANGHAEVRPDLRCPVEDWHQ